MKRKLLIPSSPEFLRPFVDAVTAARHFNVSQSLLHRLARAQVIPFYKVGPHTLRFRMDELAEVLHEESPVHPPPTTLTPTEGGAHGGPNSASDHVAPAPPLRRPTPGGRQRPVASMRNLERLPRRRRRPGLRRVVRPALSGD